MIDYIVVVADLWFDILFDLYHYFSMDKAVRLRFKLVFYRYGLSLSYLEWLPLQNRVTSVV